MEPERTVSRPAVPARGDVATARRGPRLSPTNGKVFFSDVYGSDYVCSGSALNSRSKRVVVTAGHCVHDGPEGTWHRNWVFVPGYRDGYAPFGTFAGDSMWTFNGWINHGESALGFSYDVGMVKTFKNERGRRVVKAVGGHGLKTGGARTYRTTTFGYPTNLADGERMQVCQRKVRVYRSGGIRFSRINGCRFGGGSSGGPWLQDYRSRTGRGTVRTITSFGPRSDDSYSGGPYLKSIVRGLLRDADRS